MDAPPRIPIHQHGNSASHGQGAPLPGDLYLQYAEPSPPDTIDTGNYTTDQFEGPARKRQRLSGPSVTTAHHPSLPTGAPNNPFDVPANSGSSGRVTAVPIGVVPTGKSRRVRTGCLTCRDRHLKCDEGLPNCRNCEKGKRDCEYGIRLNFIETKVGDSPKEVSPTAEWSIGFKDESRVIASEYQGGFERYVPLDQPAATPPQALGAATPQWSGQIGSTSQQQRQRVDIQESIPSFNSNSRDFSRPGVQPMYYPSNGRPTQPEPVSYDDSYGQVQDLISSGRNSEAYPPQNTMPSQVMQGIDFGSNFFPQLLDRYPPRDDDRRASLSYRSSDVSSVTSSLVPIGAGQAFQPFNAAIAQGQAPGGHEGINTPPNEKTTEKDFLNDEEEIYYIQVFIREVAIWMDSFDHEKHFSRIVPYLALRSPMLLNALLACGVKHLALTEPGFEQGNGKVSIYYDTATTQLLRSLQNPDRNMAECATTAAVLNVYEIMSERPAARMSHIAGARALIRECGWNAKSTGIGSACFWLNIGMEVLSCLAFDWHTAWDPDQWGLDISLLTGGDGDQHAGNNNAYEVGGGGEEEAWVHRIFYIVARIANFRANIPRFQEPSPHDEQVRLQSRFAEWKQLKAMADRWNNKSPRPMRPFGYVNRRSSKSLFPNVWLIRRAAVIGRLFYHTAMCLLAQINPINPRDSEENRESAIHHAHQVCGIVAHTADHGVASVAIRSLTISSSVLVDPAERAEVLAILDRIHADSGWKLGTVLRELRKAWNWREQQPNAATGGGGVGLAPLVPPPPGLQQGGGFAAVPSAAMPAMPRPINPLLAKADFSHPEHPYSRWYRKPNGPSAATIRGLWCP